MMCHVVFRVAWDLGGTSCSVKNFGRFCLGFARIETEDAETPTLPRNQDRNGGESMKFNWRLAVSAASICLIGLGTSPFPAQAEAGEDPQGTAGANSVDYVWTPSANNSCPNPDTICAELLSPHINGIKKKCCVYPSSLGTWNPSACVSASGEPIPISDRDVVPE